MNTEQTEQIRQIKEWIATLEERTHKLLDFDIADLRPDQREAAASRHLLVIGRFHELLVQLENLQSSPDSDEQVVMALITGTSTMVNALPAIPDRPI